MAWAFVLAFACLSPAAQADEAAFPWAAFNRVIAVQTFAIQQDYVEWDRQGRTVDGVFDSEQGIWSGAALQLRWQGALAAVPLWVQLALAESQGQTHYNGYLQSGSQLTPFQAKTGNLNRREHLRLGVPWALSQQPVQLIPYVEFAAERWTRNLVQYSEAYTQATQSMGLLAQWKFSPRWVAELGYQQGQQSAHLRAASLAFDADLGNGQQQNTDIALHYRMTERLRVHLQASQTQYSNGQSAVVNGLQAPPSTTRQTQWGVALAWHY